MPDAVLGAVQQEQRVAPRAHAPGVNLQAQLVHGGLTLLLQEPHLRIDGALRGDNGSALHRALGLLGRVQRALERGDALGGGGQARVC